MGCDEAWFLAFNVLGFMILNGVVWKFSWNEIPRLVGDVWSGLKCKA